jgi:hypothetical protein
MFPKNTKMSSSESSNIEETELHSDSGNGRTVWSAIHQHPTSEMVPMV